MAGKGNRSVEPEGGILTVETVAPEDKAVKVVRGSISTTTHNRWSVFLEKYPTLQNADALEMAILNLMESKAGRLQDLLQAVLAARAQSVFMAQDEREESETETG